MGDSGKGKKRLVVITFSSLFLIVMGVAATVAYVTHHRGNKKGGAAGTDGISASQKAIQSICQPTDFKEICVESLTSAAPNVTDPKELIKAGFNAAVKRLNEAGQKSITIKELEKDPRASQALQNCKELFDYAISDLRRSVDQVTSFDLTNVQPMVADIKTWLSAAVTYHETCLDGFANTTGTAGETMRKTLNASAEITRNGLAMVDSISKLLTTIKIPGISRRLLAENNASASPVWVDSMRRQMLEGAELKPDFVVAQKGGGQAKTINEALAHIPKNNKKPFVLYVKEGVYQETVVFDKTMTNVILVGDGPTKTTITNNKNFVDGVPTFKTSTVSVMAENFLAKNIGFENSAGAEKHQAVALRVQGDKAIFFNCQMDGYQDTLYVHAYRQFYRDCTVSGTIDFIFGDASAILQNCKLVVRKPMVNQQCIVTAQGRQDGRQPTAIILQNCNIVADPAFSKPTKAYLGRPWKAFSKTIIMDSFIDGLIDPTGWLPWMGDFGLNTCYYAELNNRGPGSNKNARVTWRGIKNITPQEGEQYTPNAYFGGGAWITPSRVPFYGGKAVGLPTVTPSVVPSTVPAAAEAVEKAPKMMKGRGGKGKKLKNGSKPMHKIKSKIKTSHKSKPKFKKAKAHHAHA